MVRVICDKCNKEIGNDSKTFDYFCEGIGMCRKEVDLCDKCANELINTLEMILRENIHIENGGLYYEGRRV